MSEWSGQVLQPDEDWHISGATSQTHIFIGHWIMSEDGGAIIATSVRFEISPIRAVIQYDDGMNHITTNPDVLAFLNSLVPSLEAIAS